MLNRLLQLTEKYSFFLFGARGVGKSTLIKHQFNNSQSVYIDLLDPELEDHFARHPNELTARILALPSQITHVIIDEIQKLPKLLDIIHSLIESTDKLFILTGSSARKLKRGQANLLAGRAIVYHLFPFSFVELGDHFSLDNALHWGLLPNLNTIDEYEIKKHYLQSYAHTYLKEEIWNEHIIRKLDPFRRFLEVAAQCNGKIINYANIARDVGVDEKTIKSYFEILEDTLIGFFLEPFHDSLRKRLSLKPKFYFFDIGITRALARMLNVPVKSGTSYYGEVFEHFVILECKKLASYYHSDYQFSYLMTKDHTEIDLVIDRPGKKTLLIEIKSSESITENKLASYSKITKDFSNSEAICLSNDPVAKQFGHIKALHWYIGIKQYFYSSQSE